MSLLAKHASRSYSVWGSRTVKTSAPFKKGLSVRFASWFVAWVVFLARVAAADGPGIEGKWKTSLGLVTISKEGDQYTAKFADARIPTVKGTLKDKVASLKSEDGKPKGEASVTLGGTGLSFTGSFRFPNGFQRVWQGFRPDPEAARGKTGEFAGPWLTNLGLMELEQDGETVKGRYALRGGSTLDGQVKGRHLDLHYQWFRDGSGWFDLANDGKTFEGAALGDGSSEWYGWKGRRAPEYVRHAPPRAGTIVDGSTRNLLTYSLRAPEGYKPGDPGKWPTIVILHGSNMNARAYVSTIAAAWPEIARNHLILGINGEMPSSTSETPQFNYTYVDFVGKSTYQGFPGTDRESPALVSEALAELKGVYPMGRLFVGGHSQGGWLTYSLLMNYPEMFAGAFPVSCGLLTQCEPSVFADPALREAQRRVPLAIVHASNDPIQGFGLSEAAARAFEDESWPAARLFTDDKSGHMFARLPVDRAIAWLAAMAADDPEVVIALAEREAEGGRFREAIAALNRARGMTVEARLGERVDRLGTMLDARARPGAAEYLPRIRADADGSWVDGFLAYRHDFEFAPSAREVMDVYAALRGKQEPEARRLMGEARSAFQNGKQDEGYRIYQQIVDKYHASSVYRDVRARLKSRP